MKTLFYLLLTLFFCLPVNAIVACTCDRLYFCDVLHHEADKTVVFKAVIDKHKIYGPDNRAIYLRILQEFRDDVDMPPYIKLYGDNGGSQCQFTLSDNWKVGDTVFMSITLEYEGAEWSYPIDNPEALVEDIWEFAPSYCLMAILHVKHGILRGPVAPSIVEYPEVAFESGLIDCSYNLETAYQYRCADPAFIIYPNPTPDGQITIANHYRYSAITIIRLYSMDGKLLFTGNREPGPFYQTLIGLPHSGLFIVAYTCGENTFYSKVIVE